jgi:hypothetical protein
MAVTASGIFVATMLDILDVTALDTNFDQDDHKAAMFTDSITPNFDSDTAYGSAPYNANEVSGAGYTAGGNTLTGSTIVGSSGSLVHDATDVAWSSSTITNAMCALVYADAETGNNVLYLVDFVTAFSTNNGTFTIQWHATGIWAIDLTP